MKFMRSAGAAALLALLATAASGAEPLQPSGQWNVDFGDAHCIAMRDYGTKAAPLFLALKPSPVGDVVQLSVLRASGDKGISQFGGTIAVDEAAPIKVSVLGYPGKSGGLRVAAINLPLDRFRPVRTASVLRVRSGSGVSHSFALTQMAPVAAALDRCVAGLRAAWHIGETGGGVSQPAKPKQPLPSYFSTNDYPAVAVRNEATGTVAMVTLIDETGKVASCMVTETSGYASLDAQSCAIVSGRARFDPALGADGKPLKSGSTQRIRWVM
jgi:TonB family protein